MGGLLAVLALAAVGCAPRAPALTGNPAPARLPRAELPSVHRTLVYKWRYSDPDIRAAGEAVARVAPPDSARLDFFVGGGMGGGSATLVGRELRAPGRSLVRNLLPPPALLWAALGRLDVGELPDTVVRLDGDTLRVEFGPEPRWRATFAGDSLRRLELIEGGRITQRVSREPTGTTTYSSPAARRSLELTLLRVDTVSGYDPAIWR